MNLDRYIEELKARERGLRHPDHRGRCRRGWHFRISLGNAKAGILSR